MQCIFNFTQYRRFIRHWIATKPSRTLIGLAHELGYSKSFLSRVLSEEPIQRRNLRLADTQRMCNALELDEDESEYFQLMVRFDLAESQATRERIWREMTAIRRIQRMRQQEFEKTGLFEKLHTSVILESTRCGSFTIEQLGRQLRPPLDENELQRNLDLLTELGLLQWDHRGRPQSSLDVAITFPSRGSLHRQALRRAIRGLDEIADEERVTMGAVIALPANALKDLHQILRRCIVDTLALTNTDGTNNDCVYQLVLHAIPATQACEENPQI